ncbi:MAG: DUF2846 domain-containing protein [Moraxellaceae bacterium]|nr:DUF2846 domain-containing protein [Moraxellaceae bacterium]
MRHSKALFVAALALVMTACSNPQYIIHPSSSPTATQSRQTLDAIIDTTSFKPLVMGSFMFPAKGKMFQPLIPTDSRNAIVYVFRPQSAWGDQEVQSPGFFLNGQFISGLKSGSYFWFEVPASEYYFTAKRPLGPLYLKTIFQADVFFEGNKTYFFRYDEENPGPKKPVKDSAMLVVGPIKQMPESQALTEIRLTRVMGVGRVFLADEQPAWAPFDVYADAQPVLRESLDATADKVTQLRSETEIRESRGEPDVDLDHIPEKRWWNPLSW